MDSCQSPRFEKMSMRVAAALWCSLACSFVCGPLYAQSPLPVDSIKLPPGFAIEVVARVPNARAMTWGAAGTLFVGSANEGSVYAIQLPPAGSKGRSSQPGRVVMRTSGMITERPGSSWPEM